MDIRPGSQPPTPGSDEAKIVFLAGAVAHWWDANWDTPEHYEYMKWRQEVHTALQAGGYLVYAHFLAFKGTWNPRAQKVNNFALENSDLMLIMTDESIPSPGTDEEVDIAKAAGVPILRAPSSLGLARLLPAVHDALTTAPPIYTEVIKAQVIKVIKCAYCGVENLSTDGHCSICGARDWKQPETK